MWCCRLTFRCVVIAANTPQRLVFTPPPPLFLFLIFHIFIYSFDGHVRVVPFGLLRIAFGHVELVAISCSRNLYRTPFFQISCFTFCLPGYLPYSITLYFVLRWDFRTLNFPFYIYTILYPASDIFHTLLGFYFAPFAPFLHVSIFFFISLFNV